MKKNSKEKENDTANKENKSSIAITEETIRNLQQKLDKFEASEKYLYKELSLTWLANNFSTNTKYLSEIIKLRTNKSFTSYINDLRIKYIIKKLYNDPKYKKYKISYLAEECGFTTQRIFLNAFKNETGFTPSYFIEQLNKK